LEATTEDAVDKAEFDTIDQIIQAVIQVVPWYDTNNNNNNPNLSSTP